MKLKFVAIVAVVEGLVLLVLLLNSLGAFDSLAKFELFGCGGEIYASAPSPDGRRTAYVFERDCGATTGSTTSLIVRDSQSKLDLSNDLVEDEILFVADGVYQPKLNWRANDKLKVAFDAFGAPQAKDVSFQIIKKGGLTIDYQGLGK